MAGGAITLEDTDVVDVSQPPTSVLDIQVDDNDEEEPDNSQLGDVLRFYKCHELLPYAQRIIWLSSVKESLGYIPEEFGLEYLDIRLLVVLQEENGKKMAVENYKMRQKNKMQMSDIETS